MLISAENLSYAYSKGGPFEKLALENININIDKGEFVAVIGHTGSGKSTLIQHFNGLLKPTSGKITINGLDTIKGNLKDIRKHVGIVFQYPEHQLFEETVHKDIAFGLQKQGLSKEEIDKRVVRISEQVGLTEEILLKSPFELSGGQKRRVAIAGVLVMEPQILVLDEPSAGLDPAGRDDIFRLISNLHKNLGITIIFVSHSMEDVARLAERVIVLNHGSIEMDGPTPKIFKETERLESIGLSVPQISYLMKRLKSIIPTLNDEVYTVEAAKNEIMRQLGRSPV